MASQAARCATEILLAVAAGMKSCGQVGQLMQACITCPANSIDPADNFGSILAWLSDCLNSIKDLIRQILADDEALTALVVEARDLLPENATLPDVVIHKLTTYQVAQTDALKTLNDKHEEIKANGRLILQLMRPKSHKCSRMTTTLPSTTRR